MFTYGIFCQQDGEHDVQLHSGRCLIFSLFLTGILLHNFYTSVLVSNLIQFTPDAVQNLYEFSDSKLLAAFRNVSYIVQFLKVSKPMA